VTVPVQTGFAVAPTRRNLGGPELVGRKSDHLETRGGTAHRNARLDARQKMEMQKPLELGRPDVRSYSETESVPDSVIAPCRLIQDIKTEA